MRTDWVEHDVMRLILAALMPHNRLAVTVSLVTGMRISDVLDLKRSDLRKDRITYTEYKTLKRRTIRLPSKLRSELMAISGKIFVFEHRLDPLRPRTRQAVYKDIKRAAAAFRVPLNVAPHSARKIYAVAEYKKDMNVARVKELLNHSSEAVTLIYIMADVLTERNQQKKRVQG